MIGRRRANPPHACRGPATRIAALFAAAMLANLGANEAAAQRTRFPRGIPAAGQLGGGQFVMGRGNAFLMRQNDDVEFTGPFVEHNGQITPSTSGVQLALNVRSIGQFGYQPVTATLTYAAAATADRRIRIAFHAGGWYGDKDSITATGMMTVKRGAMSATASLLVPQFQYWQGCGWDVRIDDVPNEELSFDFANLSQQQQPGVGVCALIASPSLPPWMFQAALQAVGNTSAAIRSTLPKDLPTDWKDFSAFDVVLLPAGEFAGVAQQHPRQIAALLRWVRTGGNLWLVDAAPTWDELPDVERVLGVSLVKPNDNEVEVDSAPATSKVAADAAILSRGWRFVPLGDRALEPVEGALALSGYDVDDAPDLATLAPGGGRPQPKVSAKQVETSQEWFAVRALGLGTVTVFRADLRDAANPGGTTSAPGSGYVDPTLGVDPAATVPWNQGVDGNAYGQPSEPLDPAIIQQFSKAQAARYAVQRSLLMPRLAWTSRHGNKPDEANLDFNNLLIPDVGEAPVGQFQFLISLFVIAIGPLNYWWFKRRKKLPMLLATVPAAATVVTLLLLSVGVLADGLGVRVRARSLTLLDQTAGEATTWSRLTYYAGISPRDGLAVSRDAVVYPILSPWSERRGWRGNSIKRSVTWDDKQRLTNGWLASRIPTQYLAVAARPSDKRLVLRADNGGLRILNRLGVTVTHLVVQDHDGKLYWCEGLEPEAGRVVPAVQPRDISIKLRRLFLDNFPEFPAGAAPTQYGYNDYGAVLAKNLMEAQLDAINSPVVRRWIDGGYIAVTDHGVDLDLGVDNAVEEASFHVIRGTW